MPLLIPPAQYSVFQITTRYPRGLIMQGIRENPQLYKWIGIESHNGVDYGAPYGTPILSAFNNLCKIVDVRHDSTGYGKHVRTVSVEKINGFYWECIYGHLSNIRVNQDDYVKAGSIIGECGNTGFTVSTPNANGYWYANPYQGTHLHFGVRRLSEPKDFTGQIRFPNGESYTIEDYDNGIAGYIDPLPLFYEKDLSVLWSGIASLWRSLSLLKK